MALAVDTVLGVPGVYRQPAERAAGFPRLRTDVVGFVGVAGPNRLGEAVRVDDWRSYEQIFLRDARNRPLAPPAGAQLADCVRAFFANGGARCWIVNVAERIEASQAGALLEAMLGLYEPIGLERLLRVREVAIIGLPELDATIAVDEVAELPVTLADQSRFVCCPAIREVPSTVEALRAQGGRLFTDGQVQDAQRHLIERCGREKWRVFAIATPRDGLSPQQALAWRAAVTPSPDDGDCAAFYWPWVFAQEKPGAQTVLRSPLGYVAGVFARRDLARGPHVAPANETLAGVVGVQWTLDDETHGFVHGHGVNVLRPFPNRGVQVWGARTLRWPTTPPDPAAELDPLVYVNVRRCLSAIERTVELIGQSAVFEPHQPLLRFQLAQGIVGYLLDVFAQGAFKGRTPEEAFFVRCDASNNPPDSASDGRLVCDVGVAIAEPAEFVVFRIGRNEGVVEIQEVR